MKDNNGRRKRKKMSSRKIRKNNYQFKIQSLQKVGDRILHAHELRLLHDIIKAAVGTIKYNNCTTYNRTI